MNGLDVKNNLKNIVYLKTHRMRHKNNRKYKCEYEGCSKEYKNREGLNNYIMNIHTNRYVCDYENCGYKAKKSSEIPMREVLSVNTRDVLQI